MDGAVDVVNAGVGLARFHTCPFFAQSWNNGLELLFLFSIMGGEGLG
jgi:hypothetical protein